MLLLLLLLLLLKCSAMICKIRSTSSPEMPG
jgi:hypothetical protein